MCRRERLRFALKGTPLVPDLTKSCYWWLPVGKTLLLVSEYYFYCWGGGGGVQILAEFLILICDFVLINKDKIPLKRGISLQ